MFMATEEKQIRAVAWTEISAAGNSGYYENGGPHRAWIREAASLPAASVRNGHRYSSRDQKDRFDNTPGLYARISDGAPSTAEQLMIVTED